MTRVVVLSQIPTPYRVPFYRLLAARPDVDLEVLFCAAGEAGRPWRLDEQLAEVPHRVLPHVRLRKDDANALAYSINPTVIREIRRAKPDVLVVSGYAIFAEQAALLYARTAGLPYVLHSESHLLKRRPVWVDWTKQLLLPLLLRNAAAGLAAGSAAAEYLAAYGIDRSRIRILPNTIDVHAYAAAAADVRARAASVRAERGLPERFALYVGRLLELKGVGDLLAAQRQLADAALPLVIAGTGPLEEAARATPGVHLVGFQDTRSLIELFTLAEVTVVPSRSESWGVVVNESLACSTPVIVSDAVGAVPDLVEDGANGRIVPAGDVEALAAALAQPAPPGAPGNRVLRWDYDFAVEQFVEAVAIALSRR